MMNLPFVFHDHSLQYYDCLNRVWIFNSAEHIESAGHFFLKAMRNYCEIRSFPSIIASSVSISIGFARK